MNTYIKITFGDESHCVCEPKDVTDLTMGATGYTLSEVQMSETDFDALPEFQG